MELRGTEAYTLELSGSIAAHDARSRLCVPDAQAPGAGDRVPVSVLLVRMVGLRPAALPVPGLNYGEALWRIEADGGGAWFAAACDLDDRLVRAAGASLVRYPVRRATLDFDPRDDGSLTVTVGHAGARFTVAGWPRSDATPDPVPPRRVLVRSRGRLYRIPWREEPAPWRRHATVEVRDDGLAALTLGPSVRWDAFGVLHRGRIHRCGAARPAGAR